MLMVFYRKMHDLNMNILLSMNGGDADIIKRFLFLILHWEIVIYWAVQFCWWLGDKLSFKERQA